MKITYAIFGILMILFTACASTPYTPGKPEMSVPEDNAYKAQPKTFNQFHNDWDY